jgi:hypothetical protein
MGRRRLLANRWSSMRASGESTLQSQRFAMMMNMEMGETARTKQYVMSRTVRVDDADGEKAKGDDVSGVHQHGGIRCAQKRKRKSGCYRAGAGNGYATRHGGDDAYVGLHLRYFDGHGQSRAYLARGATERNLGRGSGTRWWYAARVPSVRRKNGYCGLPGNVMLLRPLQGQRETAGWSGIFPGWYAADLCPPRDAVQDMCE